MCFIVIFTSYGKSHSGTQLFKYLLRKHFDFMVILTCNCQVDYGIFRRKAHCLWWIFQWQVDCKWKSANYTAYGYIPLTETLYIEIFFWQLHSLCNYFTGRYTAYGSISLSVARPPEIFHLRVHCRWKYCSARCTAMNICTW
jgi:hypothetical protein